MVAKGDYVKVGDSYGYVTKVVSDDEVTYQTASGRFYTAEAANMEVTKKGFGSFIKGEGPNAIELAENIVVFQLVDFVRGGKPFNKRVLTFTGLDAVYEFIVKGFFRQWGVEFIGDPQKDLTEDEFKSWTVTSDFTDAANKTLSLTILNIVKRFAMSETIADISQLYLVLQTLASLYLANAGHRMILGKDAKTYRHPQ